MEIKSVGMGYAGAGNITSAPTSPVQPEEKVEEVAVASGAAQEAPKQEQVSVKNGEQDSDKRGKEPTDDQIQKAVEEINKKGNNTEAVFGIHEKTNRVTIKIVDKETKDVIKEVPAEKTLDLIAKAWELAGILVDEKR